MIQTQWHIWTSGTLTQRQSGELNRKHKLNAKTKHYDLRYSKTSENQRCSKNLNHFIALKLSLVATPESHCNLCNFSSDLFRKLLMPQFHEFVIFVELFFWSWLISKSCKHGFEKGIFLLSHVDWSKMFTISGWQSYVVTCIGKLLFVGVYIAWMCHYHCLHSSLAG